MKDQELTLVQKYGPYAQKRYNNLLKSAAANEKMYRNYMKNFESDLDYESDNMDTLLHRALDLTKKKKSKKPISMN